MERNPSQQAGYLCECLVSWFHDELLPYVKNEAESGKEKLKELLRSRWERGMAEWREFANTVGQCGKPGISGILMWEDYLVVSIADMLGSQANDPMKMDSGNVVTTTNNNGGINGGITNGMPIIFRTAIKPTPTIFKPQNTIDFKTMTETVLEPKGRHDPAIVHRARVVQDAATAIVLCDALSMRFGTDFLK